jgi:hypothetical protein
VAWCDLSQYSWVSAEDKVLLVVELSAPLWTDESMLLLTMVVLIRVRPCEVLSQEEE